MTTFRSPMTFLGTHCDDTGLVRAESYAAVLNRLVEDWFEEALDCPFARLHAEHGAAIPAVQIDLRIDRPATLGQRLELVLGVSHLGSRSLTLCIHGDSCLQADVVLVWVDNGGAEPRSAPIPGALRRRMAAYRTGTAETADGATETNAR